MAATALPSVSAAALNRPLLLIFVLFFYFFYFPCKQAPPHPHTPSCLNSALCLLASQQDIQVHPSDWDKELTLSSSRPQGCCVHVTLREACVVCLLVQNSEKVSF